MANVLTAFINLMPHRLLAAMLTRRRFTSFANTNGLVYFGTALPHDDHDPIRGFTAHVGQIDNHLMHGTVGSHDVTMALRTVTHTRNPRLRRNYTQTWMIASITLDEVTVPHALMLSHQHPRLSEEALYLHQHRSEHVALEYRLDAQFLIYARGSDTDDIRAVVTEDVTTGLLAHLDYDYEFDAGTLYLYRQGTNPSADDLSRLLSMAVRIATSLETQ